jgi:hypothetical protein
MLIKELTAKAGFLSFCLYPLTEVNGKEYSTMQFAALLFPFPSAKADGLNWVASGHQPEGWC